jgi:di/tricarboxylate transporter
MDYSLTVTILVLIGALLLFLTDRLRADVVALLLIVVLGISGVLTPQEAFSGFSRSAVITIMSIFILAEGLRRTGVTDKIGTLLLRVAGTEEKRLVAVIMVAGAFLSLFMNNIAAASVLLPAVSGAARKAGVNPSRLLMPLAFATILGGMATLFTTANIVVSGVLRDANLRAFGIFDFAPIGIPVVIVGILYILFWGRRQLPDQSPAERMNPTPSQEDLIGTYRLDTKLFRARIPADSVLIDKSLATSTLREEYDVHVVAIERGDDLILNPAPSTILQQNDIMLVEGDLPTFRERDVEPYLEILPTQISTDRDLESPTVMVVEAVLPPRSALIGKTLRESLFRDKYGMTVLAIWRGNQPFFSDITEQPLQFGDALLLQGPRSRLPLLQNDRDLILLSDKAERPVTGRGRFAVFILMFTLLLATVFSSSVGEIMLGGALAMVLLRILSMDNAYAAVEWKTVFVVAGVLPLGVALTKTGAAQLLADGLLATLGMFGPGAVLVGLVMLTTLLVQVINGPALAAIVAPIAIYAAQQSGGDPHQWALGVALASSVAFLTPLGHPVNVLVMGPGGYGFRDYLRLGFPLTVLVLVVVVGLLLVGV